MSALSVASSPPAALVPITPEPSAPAVANDDTQAESPAVQVSLSAEASLTLSISQETRITISSASGASDRNGAAPADPTKTRALSTLEAVDQAERAWVAALKAKYEGRPAPKADDAKAQPAKSGATDTAAPSSGVQITVEQDTVVEASWEVGAEVDVRA